jgi:hypothetical protein
MFLHPRHYFRTVKGIKTWAGLIVLRPMTAVAFVWIPRLAPVSYRLLHAPIPTALQLLAGAGRGLALKMSQQK